MKTYRFYGWESAHVRDSLGLTPCDYYDLLSEIWCAETCAPRMRKDWTPANKTLGQCSITAFLIQDIFGGKVYGVPLGDGNFHCYNNVEGCVFDLTSEQFGDIKLDYVHCPEQDRAAHFAKSEKKERYELLKERLLAKRAEKAKNVSKYLNRAKELRAIITPHYNCGQSVVLPFAKDAGLTEEQAMGICANFGGGLKRASACGAITGGLVVLGLFGIDNPAAYYQALRENHEGMLDCADLLRRNKELGGEKKPHCDALVYECVDLVEKILREQGKL
ncbi:MAG: C-GCAxxG-C-C family protein [Clostridia bacterium]|nr:C-GCAxxG-C-C family protein [Clostridia bacterium]